MAKEFVVIRRGIKHSRRLVVNLPLAILRYPLEERRKDDHEVGDLRLIARVVKEYRMEQVLLGFLGAEKTVLCSIDMLYSCSLEDARYPSSKTSNTSVTYPSLTFVEKHLVADHFYPETNYKIRPTVVICFGTFSNSFETRVFSRERFA